MLDGVITFDKPDAQSLDCNVVREQQSVKEFVVGENFSLAQE
jgi:CRISPR-associated protein Cas5d